MKKIVGVLLLCVALIFVVRAAPNVYDSLALRIAILKNPNLIVTQQQANSFFQLLVNYFLNNVINNGFAAATEALVGSNEKKVAAAKELKEAELNADAANLTVLDYSQTSEMYSPEGVKRACRVLQEEKETGNAALNAHLHYKSSAATDAIARGNLDSSDQPANKLLASYRQKYCSAEGIARGRCTRLSATPDASLSASTLFIGEGHETLTKEQQEAARDFTNLAVDPRPVASLEPGLEKSPAGQRYLLEQQSYNASLSMAKSAYQRALAARTLGTQ